MPPKRMKSNNSVEVTADDDNVVIKLCEDILDQVFQFLSIVSLCRSAQVCKLWNQVAKRAMSKIGIYTVVIRVEDEKHLVRQFKVKPKLSLFFCGSRPHLRSIENVDYATLYQYNATWPFMAHTIVLGVEFSMLDTQQLRCSGEMNQRTGQPWIKDGVLGIILPDTNDLSVKFAWCETNEELSSEDAQRIFEQLQPSEHKGNPVYLMFGINGYTTGSRVLAMLREKYTNSQLNLWGGTVDNFIKCNDSYPTADEIKANKDVSHPKYDSLHGFLGILLQKPRLSAYSTIVCLTDNLKSRLTEFKAKVTLRRRSLGLVCGPHSNENGFIYHAIMEAVKHQFPTVTFTAFFSSDQLHYYGCDHTSTDGKKELIHQNAISIMILTYD